jgi:hypothetical protein
MYNTLALFRGNPYKSFASCSSPLAEDGEGLADDPVCGDADTASALFVAILALGPAGAVVGVIAAPQPIG